MISNGLRAKGVVKQSQKNRPLVTIITVVRNGEKVVEETIISVVNQTYTNIEYIIVDGVSTDDTLDIIKKYEDRIDYWVSEADNGIYYAMNKGIDLVVGDWVNFMNAGDSFHRHDVIERFIESYDGESDVVYGDTQLFFKFGTYINKCLLWRQDYMPNICHQAYFVKTHLLKDSYFDTNYKICSDAKFFYDIYKSGCKYQYIPLTVCDYDSTEGVSSLTGNAKIMFIERAKLEGIDQTLKWKIKYLFFSCKTWIRGLVPGKIMNIIIEKRRSRQLQSNWCS